MEENGDNALHDSCSEQERMQHTEPELDAHSRPFFSGDSDSAPAAEVSVALLVPRRQSSLSQARAAESNASELTMAVSETRSRLDQTASMQTTLTSKRARPSQSQVLILLISFLLTSVSRAISTCAAYLICRPQYRHVWRLHKSRHCLI